jgi:hypothetical protein
VIEGKGMGHKRVFLDSKLVMTRDHDLPIHCEGIEKNFNSVPRAFTIVDKKKCCFTEHPHEPISLKDNPITNFGALAKKTAFSKLVAKKLRTSQNIEAHFA